MSTVGRPGQDVRVPASRSAPHLSMPCSTPHYLLLTEGGCPDHQSRWRFVLQGIDSPQVLSASDTEPLADNERAELLAVVRGLEALEEPSRVTLITRSRYVQQGLARSLHQWRENDWHWERFGEMVPVRDHDLWQRIDHALAFHRVECRCWRFDDAEAPARTTSNTFLKKPHFLRRPRSSRCIPAAACSVAKEIGSPSPKEHDPTRTHRPTRNRWGAATLQNICTTAARATSAPLVAS